MSDVAAVLSLREQRRILSDAEMRRVPVMLQATALFVGFAAIPLIPGGELIAGPFKASATWLALHLTLMWSACLVHKLAGESRAYDIADTLESIGYAHGIAALVGIGGRIASIWWLPIFALCAYNGSAMGRRRKDAIILSTAPLTAAAILYLQTHAVVDAVAAILIGGLGVVAWGVVSAGAERSLIEVVKRDVLQNRVTELEREQGRTEAEAERRRIAMELHDGVGATLTAARLMAHAARHDGGEQHTAQTLDALDALDQTLRDGLTDLRLAVFCLDHKSVGWRDLFARIRRHCADVSAAGSLEFAMTLQGDRQLPTPPALRLVIFRLVQEALTNTLRHAKATRIVLDIALSEGALAMMYRDNGVGLPEAPRSDGRGLTNMRKRVHDVGGTLKIESSPAGTSLDVRIPL